MSGARLKAALDGFPRMREHERNRTKSAHSARCRGRVTLFGGGGASTVELKDVPAWLSAAAGIVSACGLLLTFWQVRLVKRLAVTQFEDTLGREYRELASRLPTRALLGEELSEEEHQRALDEFIHYIDLCNEQVFLRRGKRISQPTWENWRDGIQSNLAKPAFARAWREVQARSANFRELRRLEAEEFRNDPAEWELDKPTQ